MSVTPQQPAGTVRREVIGPVTTGPADSPQTLAELLERTSGYYHPRFDKLIERLNTVPTSTTHGECIRLCVEAVNMVLQTQSQIAGELRRLERRTRPGVSLSLPIRRSA